MFTADLSVFKYVSVFEQPTVRNPLKKIGTIIKLAETCNQNHDSSVSFMEVAHLAMEFYNLDRIWNDTLPYYIEENMKTNLGLLGSQQEIFIKE